MKKTIAMMLALTIMLMAALTSVYAEQEEDRGMTYDVILTGASCTPEIIKVIRETLGMNLMEAKHFAETAPHVIGAEMSYEKAKALYNKFVSAGASAKISNNGGSVIDPETNEEQTEFRVVLTNCGSDKVSVIRLLRQMNGWDLSTAKSYADSVPVVLASGVTREQAEQIADIFRGVGAVVEIN